MKTGPKFKQGDIVRYDQGPTAVMRITNFVDNGHGFRYYGEQCVGGNVGAYETTMSPASLEDMVIWMKYHEHRKEYEGRKIKVQERGRQHSKSLEIKYKKQAEKLLELYDLLKGKITNFENKEYGRGYQDAVKEIKEEIKKIIVD